MSFMWVGMRHSEACAWTGTRNEAGAHNGMRLCRQAVHAGREGLTVLLALPTTSTYTTYTTCLRTNPRFCSPPRPAPFHPPCASGAP